MRYRVLNLNTGYISDVFLSISTAVLKARRHAELHPYNRIEIVEVIESKVNLND